MSYSGSVEKRIDHMKPNIGSVDRWIRAIIGLGILALGFTFKSWWGLIGLLPLATAVISFCGLYALLGISTCASNQAKVSHTS
jgi:amino acid permease